MFNKKKKKIKQLEMALENIRNSYNDLLAKSIAKEQKEICKLPMIPKAYRCDNCGITTHKKMKAFKIKSYNDGKWIKIYLCKSCLEN